MHIPVLNGRDFSDADTASTPDAVVIDDYMARRYWPGEDAVGKRITFDDPQKNPRWLTVVGVVKNTVRDNWVNPSEEELYVPYLQSKDYIQNPSGPFAYITLVVRTADNPSNLNSEIQATIHSIDRNVPISEVQTMDEVVAKATGDSRFYLTLLGAFACVALVLAAVGIYGVMSYSVSRRIREIGIRVALGAEKDDVLKLVILQGMVLAISGIGIGLAGALALTRLMSGLLYGTKPADPVTFAAAVLVLALVAMVSSYIPARRAAKVDPIVALRYE